MSIRLGFTSAAVAICCGPASLIGQSPRPAPSRLLGIHFSVRAPDSGTSLDHLRLRPLFAIAGLAADTPVRPERRPDSLELRMPVAPALAHGDRRMIVTVGPADTARPLAAGGRPWFNPLDRSRPRR